MHPDFDRYSDTYQHDVQRSIGFIRQEHDFFVRHKARHLVRLARRWIGDPARLSTLDVGCGIGLVDGYLVEHFGRVHGVDVSDASLAVARDRNPGVTYQAYDGTTLPVADASFDLTFAIGVLHHVPVRLRASFLAEARRATAPGGLVVVLEHNPLNPLTRLAVQRCDFDEDVILPSKGLTKRLFGRSRLTVVEDPYVLFVPWRFPGSDAIERSLRWLPLGAQYVVAGRPDPGAEPTRGRADRG